MFHLILKNMQDDAAMNRPSPEPKPAAVEEDPEEEPAAPAPALFPADTVPLSPDVTATGSPAQYAPQPEDSPEFHAQMAAADAQAQYMAQHVAMAQHQAQQAAYAAHYYAQQAAYSGLSPEQLTQMSAQLSPGQYPQSPGQYPSSPGQSPYGSPYGMQSMGYPSPQDVQMGYPASPQQQMGGYPSSPQQQMHGYPSSPQQYPPQSPQQGMAAFHTPYNSPWAGYVNGVAAAGGPPPFSLDPPASAAGCADAHSASVAAAASSASAALEFASASAAEVAAAAAGASSPILTSGEMRQRVSHTFAEEEEPLRGDQEEDETNTAGGDGAELQAPAPVLTEEEAMAEAQRVAAAAEQAEDAAMDPMMGAPEDANGFRGQVNFILKVMFLLFMFFGDSETLSGDDSG